MFRDKQTAYYNMSRSVAFQMDYAVKICFSAFDGRILFSLKKKIKLIRVIYLWSIQTNEYINNFNFGIGDM